MGRTYGEAVRAIQRQRGRAATKTRRGTHRRDTEYAEFFIFKFPLRDLSASALKTTADWSLGESAVQFPRPFFPLFRSLPRCHGVSPRG